MMVYVLCVCMYVKLLSKQSGLLVIIIYTFHSSEKEWLVHYSWAVSITSMLKQDVHAAGYNKPCRFTELVEPPSDITLY